MALGQTRVNGGILTAELVGRDLKWVNITSTGIDTAQGAINSNLELVVRAVQSYGTVTLVGNAANTGPAGNTQPQVMLAVEGLNANATALAAAINAVITGNTAQVAIFDNINGNTWQ